MTKLMFITGLGIYVLGTLTNYSDMAEQGKALSVLGLLCHVLWWGLKIFFYEEAE
jgi:hypothetical protein